MKDVQRIAAEFRAMNGSGELSVLATVVKTTGSTYRRAGARALIHSDGTTTGLISGGCLERDLFEKSRAVLSDGVPRVVTYDVQSTADDIWGLGLGCPGSVHILLELVPLTTIPEDIEFISEIMTRTQRAVMATLFSVRRSQLTAKRVMLSADGEVRHNVPDESIATAVLADCRIALQKEKSFSKQYETATETIEAFIEFLRPPLSLILFGAGADAVPTVRFAKELGWHVSVVDSRAAFLSKEHFPEADALLLSDQGCIPRVLSISQSDFVLVMTHNYEQDFRLIKSLLKTPTQYIGLLGPKTKSEMMLQVMREEGVDIDEKRLQVLHNPAGLDLGTETPEEIALSIVAEIKAASAGRNGEPLRIRTMPIHAQ
jgi:xanthine dehydrogenase accessory factor